MLFLTYLQGPLVTEWVKAMSAWLRQQVTINHVRFKDEWLWTSTMLAFNRQFADVLEQEKAKALLRRGFKMEGSDLDAYISKFEQTVRHAGLNVNDPLVLDKFTDGIPQRCTKTSIPTNNHERTNNGDMKPSTNKKHLYISKRTLTVGALHLYPLQDPYSTSGGEHPETPMQWILHKEGSGPDWQTQNKCLKISEPPPSAMAEKQSRKKLSRSRLFPSIFLR